MVDAADAAASRAPTRGPRGYGASAIGLIEGPQKYPIRETRRFFQDYRVLEGRDVVVDEPLGPDDALRVLRDAIASYQARAR